MAMRVRWLHIVLVVLLAWTARGRAGRRGYLAAVECPVGVPAGSGRRARRSLLCSSSAASWPSDVGIGDSGVGVDAWRVAGSFGRPDAVLPTRCRGVTWAGAAR